MSVDKFGHHTGKYSAVKVAGPRGEGFSLTKDGHYDIKRKRLTGVDEPQEDTDAANKRYVNEKTPVSTKTYWSFGNRRLVSVAEPKDANDAVTLQYFDNHAPKKLKGSWGFANKRLANVAAPHESSDAVNLEFLKEHVLCTTAALSGGTFFDAKGNTISKVGKPRQPDDAVSKQYLKEALANLAYAVHLKNAKGRSSQTSGQFMTSVSALLDTYYPEEPWRAWDAIIG